jgi:hypothetical protein
MSNERKTTSGREKRERKRFPIGPGLMLAIVISVIVWRQAAPQNVPAGPQVLPSHVEAAPVALPTAPDPDWLLDHWQDLDMTPEQLKRLGELHERWDRETAGLRENLALASEVFECEMAAQDGAGLTVEWIQERAAPVSELSRKLGQARRAWWQEASGVLTEQQRERAEAMWAEGLTSGKGGVS